MGATQALDGMGVELGEKESEMGRESWKERCRRTRVARSPEKALECTGRRTESQETWARTWWRPQLGTLPTPAEAPEGDQVGL